MTDRVHVKAELELFVEDAEALRKSAYDRLRTAWSGDDEFPYESPGDVPLEEVVASVLADALPIQLPGAKRSALAVEAESRGSDDEGDEADEDSDKDEEPDEDDDSDNHSDKDKDKVPDDDDSGKHRDRHEDDDHDRSEGRDDKGHHQSEDERKTDD